jgi:hypothetical protein
MNKIGISFTFVSRAQIFEILGLNILLLNISIPF